jgi:hypothetical protein
MKKSHLIFRILGILIFSTGFLLGATLFVASTWADVEAALYGFNRYGKEATSDLRCPMVVTSAENGMVTLVFENTSEYLLRPTVRYQASSPALFDVVNYRLELEPGEAEQTQLEIGADNVVLNNYIFVKVFTFASYPIPDIEQTCGVLFLDLPQIGGSAVVLFSILASLVGMGIGLVTWILSSRPIKGRAVETQRAMVFMIVAVVLGFASNLLGWWMLGVILAAITVLLIGVVVGSALQGRV